MKRKWHHPEEPATGRRYFRSIAELEGAPESPEWYTQEFPAGVAEMEDEEDADVSRRSFMRAMGGTAVLAGLGLSGCRRPESTILPFTEHVEWIVPGKSLYYATAMPRLGGCTPIVATTHEGRPTHLQGNQLHPNSNGSSDSFAIASVRDLYDPGRSMKVLNGGKDSSRAEFAKAVKKLIGKAAANGGEGVAIVVGESPSPTRDRLLTEISTKFPKIGFYKHEAINLANAEAACDKVLGEGVRQIPHFEKAHRIFALDSDFLGLEAPSAGAVSDFMSQRKPENEEGKPVAEEKMNRLYSVESRYTMTGGMADHREPVPAGEIISVATKLAENLADDDLNQVRQSLNDQVKESTVVKELEEWIAAAAADLKEFKGKALVIAGLNQPPAVHALAAAMNKALDAFGNTIELVQTPVDGPKVAPLSDIKAAWDEQKKAAVEKAKEEAENDNKTFDPESVSVDFSIKHVFYLGPSNPLYDTPSDLNWPEIHESFETSVHIGHRADATAMASTWHSPSAHFLESWGDVVDSAGVYSVVQPMILPLFDGLSEIDMLLAILGKKDLTPLSLIKQAAEAAKAAAAAKEEKAEGGNGAEGEGEAAPAAPAPAAEETSADDPALVAVQETFASLAKGDVKKAWNFTLRDGFLKGSKYEQAQATVDIAAATSLVEDADPISAPTQGAMEVTLTPDYTIWDGRYIDNAWLQETPDPISRVTWDNVALASPRTLRGLIKGSRWETGRKLSIDVRGRTLEVPAMEAPGHPQNSISISLGYGQEVAGQVGSGSGFNAYTLRTQANPYIAPGATVKPLDVVGDIVQVQEHYSMEGRAILREDTAERYDKKPEGIQKHGMDSHIPKNQSLYKGQIGEKSKDNPNGFDYEHEHQWGMTIDLNSCIGCTACLVSCVSENNIPVVGKDQVKRGRAMHWIRMDRYFVTTDDVTSDPDLDQLDNPEMITQPMACQQCESAPCETVCPVNATVHTEEGLNAMAYNRCIGTRYCANNCPYKVRRFNFFDFNKRDPLAPGNLYKGPLGKRKDFGVEKLQRNPNVTVRMRGVMEKCTYCVQRLEAAKIAQKRKARGSTDLRIPADSVKTACQQACPADCIEFGDLANPDSRVKKAKALGRNYEVLKYIGTAPRTTYLARIKNPNPKVPKTYLKGVKYHGEPVEKVGGATKWIH